MQKYAFRLNNCSSFFRKCDFFHCFFYSCLSGEKPLPLSICLLHIFSYAFPSGAGSFAVSFDSYSSHLPPSHFVAFITTFQFPASRVREVLAVGKKNNFLRFVFFLILFLSYLSLINDALHRFVTFSLSFVSSDTKNGYRLILLSTPFTIRDCNLYP